jgi:hypothetical protein
MYIIITKPGDTPASIARDLLGYRDKACEEHIAYANKDITGAKKLSAKQCFPSYSPIVLPDILCNYVVDLVYNEGPFFATAIGRLQKKSLSERKALYERSTNYRINPAPPEPPEPPPRALSSYALVKHIKAGWDSGLRFFHKMIEVQIVPHKKFCENASKQKPNDELLRRDKVPPGFKPDTFWKMARYENYLEDLHPGYPTCSIAELEKDKLKDKHK